MLFLTATLETIVAVKNVKSGDQKPHKKRGDTEKSYE